jgi:hypothetical protein
MTQEDRAVFLKSMASETTQASQEEHNQRNEN